MNSDLVVAIHAMAFLRHTGEIVPSEVLAENACTHAARVRRVMSKLKKAGLVNTREGRTEGGYSYPEGKHVTLTDLCTALDADICDLSWRSGDPERACLVSSGMSDYMDVLQQGLNETCRAYLSKITIEDVEHWLKNRKEAQL